MIAGEVYTKLDYYTCTKCAVSRFLMIFFFLMIKQRQAQLDQILWVRWHLFNEVFKLELMITATNAIDGINDLKLQLNVDDSLLEGHSRRSGRWDENACFWSSDAQKAR
jgi:hypothetical protein